MEAAFVTLHAVGEVGADERGNGQYYGRFMLKARPGSKPTLQARLVAVTLADQAGRAFGASQAARSAS